MFRKLFVPVDGSELSQRAMQCSIDLAHQLGAAVVGFVVEPEVPLPTSSTALSNLRRDTDAHVERTDTHARSVLTDFEARSAAVGVVFTGLHVRADDVDRAIADHAEREACDMIVMVTHGRGVFGELLFGSHTKDVMARSKLPLLILR
ncbi:MAG: universal stress protein [Ideonella sp.]|nr:universal stress protein [Ideonella sp.]MBL0149440.1 universal stress protein [Ideonella sp.]